MTRDFQKAMLEYFSFHNPKEASIIEFLKINLQEVFKESSNY